MHGPLPKPGVARADMQKRLDVSSVRAGDLAVATSLAEEQMQELMALGLDETSLRESGWGCSTISLGISARPLNRPLARRRLRPWPGADASQPQPPHRAGRSRTWAG
jgi:hypothetical protein